MWDFRLSFSLLLDRNSAKSHHDHNAAKSWQRWSLSVVISWHEVSVFRQI
jgi:hypothetical protein